MTYFLGVDIGSVNVKLALVDDNCSASHFYTEKITSGPRAAVTSLITRLGEKFNNEQIASAGVSGSGRTAIPKEMEWADYSSSLSIAAGLLHVHPDAKTTIVKNSSCINGNSP